MTAPRQVLRGTAYLVTRRCYRRQFLLTPTKVTTEIFRYVLAVAASRFDVKLHAYCVLSNHVHLVVTDPEARLPAFLQYLGSLVARAVNASTGRSDGMWSRERCNLVELPTPADVASKAVYVLANPVAAGLVASARQWPGLWSDPAAVGAGPVLVSRPAFFFDEEGNMPESAALELSVPGGFSSPEEFRAQLEAGLAEREGEVGRELDAEGRRPLGPLGVLAQRPTDSPATEEPRGRLKPRVASRDEALRTSVLARLARFANAYRVAWSKFREGVRDVVFPPGTYALRVCHGVCCAEPG